MSVPVSDIINSGLRVGHWPRVYKRETITPTPKQFPPEDREMLRPISNLCNLNKIMETIISELVISDMQSKLDPSQFGNQKHPALPREITEQSPHQCGQQFQRWNQCCTLHVHWLEASLLQTMPHFGCRIIHKNWCPSIPHTLAHKLLWRQTNACEMAWITIKSKKASWWKSLGSQSGQLGVPLPNKQ